MARTTVTVLQADEKGAELVIHYCLRCGKDVAVLSQGLGEYQRRESDGAYAVDEDTVKTLNTSPGAVRNLLRAGRGSERQFRFQCGACGVLVGYKDRPLEDLSSELTYLLPGVLSANPTVTMKSLHAAQLPVPACVRTERPGIGGKKKCVGVTLRVTYGAHTKVQVADVTSRCVHLQLTSSLKARELNANEALIKFFAKLLEVERGNVQLCNPTAEARASGKLDPARKKLMLGGVSCGYVYHSLIRAMIDMQYVLPSVFFNRDDV